MEKCCCCCWQPGPNRNIETLPFTAVQVIRALCQPNTLFFHEATTQARGKKKSKWSYINIYLRQSCCGGRNVLIDFSQQIQNNPQIFFFPILQPTWMANKGLKYKNPKQTNKKKYNSSFIHHQHLWSHSVRLPTKYLYKHTRLVPNICQENLWGTAWNLLGQDNWFNLLF